MVLNICKYPAAILKRRSFPVKRITEEDKSLIADMIETMKAAKGVGLAANQVGVAKRIIVFNSSEEEWKADALLNPVILKRRGSQGAEEGCLSLPGVTADVCRSKYILAEGIDIKGKPVRFEAEGLLARIIQHEIDHLNGKLFIDRINPVKRLLSLRRIKNLKNKAE